jgi:hypothetical protein
MCPPWHPVHSGDAGLEYHVNPELLLFSKGRLDRAAAMETWISRPSSLGRSTCYGAVRQGLNDQEREQQHG